MDGYTSKILMEMGTRSRKRRINSKNNKQAWKKMLQEELHASSRIDLTSVWDDRFSSNLWDPFFGMILVGTFFSRLCHWLTVQKCGYLVTLTNSRMLQILLWSYFLALTLSLFGSYFPPTKGRWCMATITFQSIHKSFSNSQKLGCTDLLLFFCI